MHLNLPAVAIGGAYHFCQALPVAFSKTQLEDHLSAELCWETGKPPNSTISLISVVRGDPFIITLARRWGGKEDKKNGQFSEPQY